MWPAGAAAPAADVDSGRGTGREDRALHDLRDDGRVQDRDGAVDSLAAAERARRGLPGADQHGLVRAGRGSARRRDALLVATDQGPAQASAPDRGGVERPRASRVQTLAVDLYEVVPDAPA